MRIGESGPRVEDTFAEAFPMTGTRLVLTAATRGWAETAARVMTGYATSVIGCDAEAGIERFLDPGETPDFRPGVSVLAFAFSRDALEKALTKRVGQCVMTCPTTACYNGLGEDEAEAGKSIVVGGKLRYFGDGWQISKRFGGRRHWRIPVMDGEFTVEERFGTRKGVAGGNLLFAGEDPSEVLRATESAVAAMGRVRGAITPFPGGIARSGSKVGSRYKGLIASTNGAYAPTTRGLPGGASGLGEGVRAVYEIVIDGLTREAVEEAMRAGMRDSDLRGVSLVTAGNYGGKLGPYHLRLRDLLGAEGGVGGGSLDSAGV